MDKCRDYREILRRVAGRIYVEPIAYDLVARILPGLVLLLGYFVVIESYTFTRDLVVAFWGWIAILVVLVVAEFVGKLLIALSRWVGYARPLQPRGKGWGKYLWLEGLQDFEQRAPIALRRTAGRLRILTDAPIAVGAALGILLLLAIFQVNSGTGWLIFALLVALVVLRFVYRQTGAQWALVSIALLAVALLIVLLNWDHPWAWPFLGALVAIVLLRFVHRHFRLKWHQAVLRVISQDSVTTIGTREPVFFGPQGTTSEDLEYAGSRYQQVHDALFDDRRSNRYYSVWGAGGQEPLPVYRVTLASVLRGILPFGSDYQFREAAERTVRSRADLRWGPDRRGYRRLLHPNGVCLLGKWEITDETAYTGYFQKGSEGLLVARYSTCCTETRRGRKRSLSMVGKLYPTTNKNHTELLKPASFITQQDIGGDRVQYINEAEFRNNADVTVWRRGLGINGLPVILVTGLLFKRVNVEESVRQLYEIAELGKAEGQNTNAPKFMRIVVDEEQPKVEGDNLDFRDEVLGHIYDPGDLQPKRKLVFQIEVSDDGDVRGPAFYRRVTIENWRRIGRLVFDEAVASYNGDFVIHFHHPAWREDRNDPDSVVPV